MKSKKQKVYELLSDSVKKTKTYLPEDFKVKILNRNKRVFDKKYRYLTVAAAMVAMLTVIILNFKGDFLPESGKIEPISVNQRVLNLYVISNYKMPNESEFKNVEDYELLSKELEKLKNNISDSFSADEIIKEFNDLVEKINNAKK